MGTPKVWDGTQWAADPGGGRSQLHERPLSVYNHTATSMAFWRAAVARSRTGGGSARAHFFGDSITAGANLSDAVVDTQSYPDQVRALLNGRLGTSYEGPVHACSGHSKLTKGAGWATANPYGLGGAALSSAAAAGSTVTFGPLTCDTFKVYYIVGSAFGTMNLSIDGGAATPVNTFGNPVNVGSATISAGSVGSHTLTIDPGAALIYLAAVEYYTAADLTGGVRYARLGMSGYSSLNWSVDTTAGSSLGAAFTMMSPDLAVYCIGTNDQTGNVPIADYTSQVTALVTKARTKNCDVLLVTPPANNPSGTLAPPESYVAALYAIADTKNVALVDLRERWQSYAIASAAPFSFLQDALHPNYRGYADMASAVAVAMALGVAA